MTNKERQKSLDKKKWIESEKCKYDKSGSMAYCCFCSYQDEFYCTAIQEMREQNYLCATAYNRMKRNS